MPGAAVGSRILNSSFSVPAPSILAASSSSNGMLAKYPAIRNEVEHVRQYHRPVGTDQTEGPQQYEGGRDHHDGRYHSRDLHPVKHGPSKSKSKPRQRIGGKRGGEQGSQQGRGGHDEAVEDGALDAEAFTGYRSVILQRRPLRPVLNRPAILGSLGFDGCNHHPGQGGQAPQRDYAEDGHGKQPTPEMLLGAAQSLLPESEIAPQTGDVEHTHGGHQNEVHHRVSGALAESAVAKIRGVGEGAQGVGGGARPASG